MSQDTPESNPNADSPDTPSPEDAPVEQSTQDQEEHHVSMTEAPPHTIGGILLRLGPGLIIAGSIVGSGELIATTKTGAEAGFSLLWLILIGCVIKVFAQVEFGRYTLVTGNTAMTGMNEVPGRMGPVNWIMWYWLAMFVVGLAQLGGIVGSVGQACALSAPLTEQGAKYNELADARIILKDAEGLIARSQTTTTISAEDVAAAQEALPELRNRAQTLESQYRSVYEPSTNDQDQTIDSLPNDEYYWAAIITVITAIVLYQGRYNLIQSFSTILVASFTALTIVNIFALQSYDRWAVSWDEFSYGLSFHLPTTDNPNLSPVATALATFGIIGVGATELISYPYWCLEKGYARFTGPRDDTDSWASRAKGWMNVMQWDAWCSMVVYTLATVAFYLLGAAVLHRNELNPEKSDLIRTLGIMYEPVFKEWARLLFLFGSIAVLYSTFFVANAGHARVATDAINVFGLGVKTDEQRQWWIRCFSALFPFICLFMYCYFQAPAALVMASGVMQAIMLPMLGIATLFFRYYRCDQRIAPNIVWDGFLWVSVLGLVIVGVSTAYLVVKSFVDKQREVSLIYDAVSPYVACVLN